MTAILTAHLWWAAFTKPNVTQLSLTRKANYPTLKNSVVFVQKKWMAKVLTNSVLMTPQAKSVPSYKVAMQPVS
ncbi:hypothetical protein D3C80_980850 [compost metagenome]